LAETEGGKFPIRSVTAPHKVPDPSKSNEGDSTTGITEIIDIVADEKYVIKGGKVETTPFTCVVAKKDTQLYCFGGITQDQIKNIKGKITAVDTDGVKNGTICAINQRGLLRCFKQDIKPIDDWIDKINRSNQLYATQKHSLDITGLGICAIREDKTLFCTKGRSNFPAKLSEFINTEKFFAPGGYIVAISTSGSIQLHPLGQDIVLNLGEKSKKYLDIAMINNTEQIFAINMNHDLESVLIPPTGIKALTIPSNMPKLRRIVMYGDYSLCGIRFDNQHIFCFGPDSIDLPNAIGFKNIRNTSEGDVICGVTDKNKALCFGAPGAKLPLVPESFRHKKTK